MPHLSCMSSHRAPGLSSALWQALTESVVNRCPRAACLLSSSWFYKMLISGVTILQTCFFSKISRLFLYIYFSGWPSESIHTVPGKKPKCVGLFTGTELIHVQTMGRSVDVTWQIYLAQSLNLRTCHNSLFMWGLSYVLQLCFQLFT